MNKNSNPWLAIILCWLAYTTSYIGRCGYSSSITSIMADYNISHADAGLVSTFFFFAYGIGQVVNGIMSKYYNRHFIISFALIASATFNLCIYMGIDFVYIKYIWMLNGIVQSVLWPNLIAALSQSLNSGDLNKGILTLSTTVPSGTIIIYGLSALMTHLGCYQYTFLVGTITMLAAGIIWACLYNKAFQNEIILTEEKTKEESKKLKPSVLALILTLALFSVVNNLVKDGITTWVPSFLSENFGLNESMSILSALLLPLTAFLVALLNQRLHRKIPSFIKLSGIWYALAAVCVFGIIKYLNSSLWWLVLILLSMTTFFMYGVNNITTNMVPMYMRSKVNSGMLAGILNGCCYAGSTISSYGLGAVADAYGWNGVFYLLLAVCIVPVVTTIIVSLVSKDL